MWTQQPASAGQMCRVQPLGKRGRRGTAAAKAVLAPTLPARHQSAGWTESPSRLAGLTGPVGGRRGQADCGPRAGRTGHCGEPAPAQARSGGGGGAAIEGKSMVWPVTASPSRRHRPAAPQARTCSPGAPAGSAATARTAAKRGCSHTASIWPSPSCPPSEATSSAMLASVAAASAGCAPGRKAPAATWAKARRGHRCRSRKAAMVDRCAERGARREALPPPPPADSARHGLQPCRHERPPT